MRPDPRIHNDPIEDETAAGFFEKYTAMLNRGLSAIDDAQLELAHRLMKGASEKGATVYAGGNGGSAAIVGHLSCDWAKSTFVEGTQPLRVHPLVSSTELMTALGNDFGYEYVFSRQLEMFARPGDLLVLISSSGKSPNIVKAVEAARKIGMPVIGFTGFSGGFLKENCDASIHVPVENYAIVEDAHQAAMQALGLYFASKRT